MKERRIVMNKQDIRVGDLVKLRGDLKEPKKYGNISLLMNCITKYEYDDYDEQYIHIRFYGGNSFALPTFEKNTMYKGMELDKDYTLEELGL